MEKKTYHGYGKKEPRFRTVKSVITLTILFVFVFLVINGSLPIEFITSIIAMVLTYYFTKDTKKDGETHG